MAPVAGSDFCWAHAPEVAPRRAAARRKGGEQTRTPYAVEPSTTERPSLADVASIRALLERAVADTLQQPNGAHRSRALAHACTVAMKVHEVGELEERLTALEQRVNEGRTGPRRMA